MFAPTGAWILDDVAQHRRETPPERLIHGLSRDVSHDVWTNGRRDPFGQSFPETRSPGEARVGGRRSARPRRAAAAVPPERLIERTPLILEPMGAAPRRAAPEVETADSGP